MTEVAGHIAFAMLAGVLLNFTPCVLPVIPIKARALLQEIDEGRGQRLLVATLFLSGSLIFFLLLTVGVVWLGWMWSDVFRSSWFLAALTVFLTVMAVLMFFDVAFPLPQVFYRMRLTGYLNALLTGFLAGILSTPCSGPFLGGVLSYALSQNAWVQFAIFPSIGFGLALPYVLILTRPELLRFVPRSSWIGAQMKQVLALILFGGALFFLQTWLEPAKRLPLIWIFTGGVVAWAGIVVGRVSSLKERLVPGMSVAVIAGFALYAYDGQGAKELKFQAYRDSAVQKSLRAGQPVLIEFTADWCVNCKVLHDTVYTSEKFTSAAKAKGLKAYQMDMTEFTRKQKKTLQKYGGHALPYAVLLNTSGDVAKSFNGMFEVETITKALEDVSAKKSGKIQLKKRWKPEQGEKLLGKEAPKWKNLKWVQGGPLSLSDLKGQVVLIRFWLKGCPYCRATAPALNEFRKRYRDEGLRVIGIHHPKSRRHLRESVVKKGIQELGFKFPVAMDNSWKTIRSYGVGSVLTEFTSVSFLVGPKGKIRFVHDGGEYHLGGGDSHQECHRAYWTMRKKIESLLDSRQGNDGESKSQET